MGLATTFLNRSSTKTKLRKDNPFNRHQTPNQKRTKLLPTITRQTQSTAPGEKNTGWDFTNPGKSGISCQCHVNVYSRCDAGFITRLNSHSQQAFAVPNSTQSHPIRTDSSKELEYVSPNSLVDERPRTKHHSKTDIIASSPKRCYPLHPTPPQSIQNDTFTPVLKNKAEQKKKTCRETNFMKRW